MEKKRDEAGIEDTDLHCALYSDSWVVFADKGYQGVQELMRGIHQIKKPVNGVLYSSDVLFKESGSSD